MNYLGEVREELGCVVILSQDQQSTFAALTTVAAAGNSKQSTEYAEGAFVAVVLVPYKNTRVSASTECN